MEDMTVAQVDYDNWGEESDPESDWNLIQAMCCFSHRDACEFIVYIGDGGDGSIDRIAELKEAGLSEEFMEECQAAKEAGFKYICFYA